MRNPNSIPSRTARVLAWLAVWGPALAIGGAFATVVGTTGFVSYTHISALMLQAQQSWKTAHLTAVFVDGQIVIGSVFFMVVVGKQRFYGLIGIVPGVLESLYANWESGITHGWRDALIAAVAAQVFACSSFLFERWLKSQGGRHVAHVRIVTFGCGHGVAEDRDGRIRDLWSHIKDCLGGDPSYRGVGAMLGIHNEIVRQVVTAMAEGGGGISEPAAGASEGHALAALNGTAP